MLITSFGFLLLLAASTVVYYLLPMRFRWIVLLASSAVFYAYFGLHNAICLSATIITTYAAALAIGHFHKRTDSAIAALGEGTSREEKQIIRKKGQAIRRIFLTACLLINLGFLALVKLDGSLIMPVGLSFYTFRALAYLIDVYRGEVKAESNLPRFMLFCAYFPQILMGPISRYQEVAPALFDGNRFDINNLSAGARRTLFGFFKKLVIADRLMPVVRELTGVRELTAETGQGADVFIALMLYGVALYCDFSGGLDIALGSAKMVGVRLPENFNKPFIAVSITDYWQRWHITMGTWFRDYLFYPLSTAKPVRTVSKWMQSHIGSNFGKRMPVYIITLIVWFSTGAWHGASMNYIGWGLVNGAVIILSLLCESLYKRFHLRFPAAGKTGWYRAFMIVRTFCIVRLISAFFLYEDFKTTVRALLSMFTDFQTSSFAGLTELMALPDWIVAGAGTALLIILGMQKKDAFERLRPFVRRTAVLLLLLIVLVFGLYGFGYDINQFIYNRF